MKKSNGFTLLEVMISLAILSIAVSSLLIARNNSIKEAKNTIEIRRINVLLELKMAELISGIEKDTSGNFKGEENTGYMWRASITREPVKYSTSSNQGEVEIELKKIEVMVKRINSTLSKNLLGYFFIKNPEDEKELKNPEEKKD